MRFTSDKFILAMMHSEMLIVANVYQTIIASPSIRMDYAVDINTTPYNALQRHGFDIRNNFCIDFSLSF